MMRKRDTEDPKDYEVYNFKDSGDGNSWLLGDDSKNWANAFKGGYKECPVDIIVPRSLTSKEGETRPVEVIGQRAYLNCGAYLYGYKTKTVFVTKQVRIIKEKGFGNMWNVESFRIEEGSVLQSIDRYGLDLIGTKTGQNNESMRRTIILPSTLSYVASDGIRQCDIFNVIIYCGTHSLTNPCDLEYNDKNNDFGVIIKDTNVSVTDQYPESTIFGRTALKDSQTEVQEKCVYYRYDYKYEETEQGAIITGWGNETDNWCPIKLEIPGEINGSVVIAVNDSAFANCDSKSPILLPSTLKWVGASAFANTSHVTAIICNSIELEVREFAFQSCGSGGEQPINVSLPQNITTKKGAFAKAKIGEVYIL